MVYGRVRNLMGWALPAFLLAMLLHAHPASEGALRPQLNSSEPACPVCATLAGGAEAPQPPASLYPQPSAAPIRLDQAIEPEFARIPIILSLRGPPSQA